MPKLFSNHTKKFLKQVDRPEKDLNEFICENWNSLFDHLTFIASEFPLSGNVRDVGTAGRIDILAYNPITRRFVIFELKKEHDKNITDQAADYRDYVQENFAYFHEFLKKHTNVEIEAQQSKMKVSTGKTTFSAIGLGGKTGRKAILQINTNINVINSPELANILIEDRYRGEGQKKKGSLGSQRYEVFIRNLDEMKQLCSFIKDSI